MLHKTYLAICSGANKSVREGWKSSLSGKDASCLENFGLPLGAKLLRLAPKSLTSHDATNTQIGATSTQLAKRVEKELRRHLYLPRRRANRRCPPSQKSLIGMRSFSRVCIANTYGTSTMQSKGCICERRYNCSDAGKGKSAMGFLNEGMDNSTFYAGEDNRHHRHTSLSDKWSSPDVEIFEQMRKPLLV